MASALINGPPPPDVNRRHVMDTVAWVGTTLATILVAIRIYTRARILRCADWLDVLVAVSAVLGIVASALNTVADDYGAGRHVYWVVRDPNDNLTRASLYGTISVPFSQIAMALPKIATASALLRIAGPSATLPIRLYFYVLTISLAVLSSLYCILIFVQCRPAFALWTGATDASCWPREVVPIFGIVVSGISAYIDLNLALYPVYIISRLEKMSTRRKVSCCVLMGLGLVATICAGFKIAHLRDQQKPDVTFDIVDLVCWTLSEMNLILIAASVPFLKPLLAGVRDGVAERRKGAVKAWTVEHGSGSGKSGAAGARSTGDQRYGKLGAMGDSLVSGTEDEDYAALANERQAPVSPVYGHGETIMTASPQRGHSKAGESSIELHEMV